MKTIEMKWLREVNWPLLQTGFPFMRDLRLRLSDARWDFLEIKAAVKYRSFILGDCSLRAEPSGSQEVTFPSPKFHWRFENCLLFVDDTAPVRAALELSVRIDTREQPTVYELPELPVHVLSPKQWDCGIGTDETGKVAYASSYPYFRWSASFGEHTSTTASEPYEEDLTPSQQLLVLSSIAALCLPSHKAIAQLCRDTETAIHGVETGDEAEPIYLQQSTDGRLKLFRTLYAQLSKRQVAYMIEDVAFAPDQASWTQRVRLPDELTQDSIGHLTCIDWALIPAAACEVWGIDPLILLVQRAGGLHALTAIRTVEADRVDATRSAVFRLSPAARDSLLTADFTVRSSFSEAMQGAAQCLTTSAFCVAIDILAARSAGCSALPLHQKSSPRNDEFHKRYCGSAPAVVNKFKFKTESHMSPEEIFVPLQCEVLTHPTLGALDALDYVWHHTESEPSKIAILANSGAGKSYLLAKLYLEKLKAFCERPGSTRIPVFFPLRQFVSSRSLEGHLQDHLCALGYPAASEEAFHQEVTEGKFALYLDALDEIPLRGGADVERLLEQINPILTLPNVEVVLTARFGLFGSKALSLLPQCDVVLLRAWGEANWWDFLERYTARTYINQAEAEALKHVRGPVRNLITKPLYCQMIVEERDRILQHGIQNEADLFRGYIARFWNLHPVAHEFLRTPEEKNACMRDIAARMEQLNRRVWTIQQLAGEINRKYAHLGSLDAWKHYLTDIRVYSFLDTAVSRAQEEAFSFSHEAFREFFLAEHLVERFNAGDRQALASTKISLEVARMMGGLLTLEPHYNPTQLLSAHRRPGAKGTAWSRNLALVQIAMAEGCPGWKLEGVDFSGLDLHNTDFTGCTLNGAQFLNCDLQDCRFDGALLNHATFDYSNIAGASFESIKGKPSFVNCDSRRHP